MDRISYRGVRESGAARVDRLVQRQSQDSAGGAALNPRLNLRRHSPTGFEWGYGGSGPAQLALALLADCLADDRRALALYQGFKDAVVARLPHEGWMLEQTEIEAALAKLEQAAAG